MTADREFPETANSILSSLMESVDAREGALFIFRDKPAMLGSITAAGFLQFPERAVIPLLPKHVHALANLRAPLSMSSKS